ncbi:MAG: PP2C family protein-serine/threonine phosphatase [Candidatus Sumerlaeia bacterium]
MIAEWNALGHTGSNHFDMADKSLVLAVHDRELRAQMKVALESRDIHVLEAADGDQALNIVLREDPDMLVCDRLLPRLDGLTLCQRVQDLQAAQEVYVLMLLHNPSEKDVANAQEAGADEWLPREASMQQLIDHVRAGLKIVHLQRGFSLRNEEFMKLTQRYNSEMESISMIQKALLPQNLPELTGFTFTSFYMPSTECGGDYYDLVKLDDNRTGFVIADVSGHGAPAMVTMALVRQNFRLISKKYEEPHLLLEEMNRLLFDHLPTDQYITMHYAILDSENLEVHYASAGHNPPLWYRAADKSVSLLKHCESFPLKLVTRDARYRSIRIQLEPLDRLIFYTDGIPECFGPGREVYGMERMEEVIREKAEERVEMLENMLITDVLSFADGHAPEDDLTLGVLGVRDV